METNIIYNKDCMKGIKKLPDNSVDLVLTDPPYDIEKEGGGGAFGSKNRKYHSDLKNNGLKDDFNIKIFDEIVRVLKKVNLYTFCNKNQILKILKYFEDYNYDVLTYHKTNPIPTCNNKYLSDTEYIIFIREKGVSLYGSYETKKKYFLQENSKSRFDHPTVKPLNIIRNLIINSTKRGGLVLDPFMGSGTTAVACKQLGRDYIGFELNEKYVKIANKRLKQSNINNWFNNDSNKEER